MDWLGLVLLAVIGLVTYRAYRNGFIRELVSLSAMILAVPIAGILYDDLYPKVHPIVDNVAAANLVSFLAILAGVLIAGQICAFLLKRMVSILDLGWADAVAGAFFGFLKGVILCQAVLLALVTFPHPDLRDEIDASDVGTGLLDAAPFVIALLPGAFDRALDALDAAVDDAPATPGRAPAP